MKHTTVNDLPIVNNWKDYYCEESSKRWIFQKEIIQKLKTYLISKYKIDKKAALVKLPTGTGKTAIMAIVSNYLRPDSNVLIIVPSEALKSQLTDYFEERHWLKVKGRPLNIKHSFFFEPSVLENKLLKNKDRPCNYVGTHHTLSILKDLDDKCGKENASSDYAKDKSLLTQLRERIDILFVDEGHREPAKKWSKTVRSFKKPTILFTATPYRNDIRFFNIGSCIEERTFQMARDDYQVVRNVDFSFPTRSYNLQSNTLNKNIEEIEIFVKQFTGDFIKKAKDTYLEAPKAIIRCSNEENIKEVKKQVEKLFRDSKFRKKNNIDDDPKFKDRIVAVSIHDNFNKRENKEYNSVERCIKESNNAIFWIHQYKLMEGIDDKDFIVLAFLSPFSNARSLVQQIGRIIRKPENEKNQNAYVFTDPTYNVKEFWEGYLAYEHDKAKLYGTEQIVSKILESFPHYFYFDKKFSRVVSKDFSTEEFIELIQKDLRIPKITNVYKVINSKIDINILLDNLSESLEDNDIIEIKKDTTKISHEVSNINVESEIGLYIGWRISPTNYLSDSIFFNISFVSYTFFYLQGYLFFRGDKNLPEFIQEKKIKLVEPNLFSGLLLSSDESLLIKQISVINSDSNTSAIRRRIEGASNIAQTASHLNDHLHVLSAAVANVDNTPRYLGITRSRISDNRGTFISVYEYIEWIFKIINRIESNKQKKISFLDRYAKYVAAPENSIPRHILFDLTGFIGKFRLEQGEELTDVMDEAFCESSAEIDWSDDDGTGTFDINFEDHSYTLRIRYLRKKFKIEIDKKTSSKIREDYPRKRTDVETASAFIKNKLNFRIITDENYFYTDDNFFNPSIKLWGEGRFENLGLIYAVEELKHVIEEKEYKSDKPPLKTTWQKNTIFHFIDLFKTKSSAQRLITKYNKNYGFFIPEFLICDDQSGELADFIAFSESIKKVVLIHAKMGIIGADKEKTFSAVKFEKVAAQVIKNLRAFDPYNFTENDLHKNWKGYWKGKDNPSKLKRIRKSAIRKTERIQEKLVDLLKQDITREVWIMYGKGFSENELKKYFKQEDPPFFIKHLAYSLMNCNESVSQAGAKLRIFTQE